ncbi:sulfurtransferase tusa [Lucifera butyrica]|uniref:Sulfurtransferase tusa n=1 Tax=Lucifera butyrica TaxID=1351585 RepID=A0A498QYT2_9FIRM|nr:sulfurtransferase TusA family protein [Lucifera butyrica]VBB05356.1 sulfurtransferase tusa [Lucifera butyrica]
MTEKFINALGDFCPVPTIKVHKAMTNMQPGDKITLLTDHSCTVTTLKEEMSKRKLDFKVAEVDYGIWEITISLWTVP